MRITIATNRAQPYRLDLFNALAVDHELSVVTSEDAPGAWVSTTPGARVDFTPRSDIPPRQDVVVSAELGIRTAQALLKHRTGGAPVVCWWGGTPRSEADRSQLRRWWRRALVPGVAGFLSYGRAADGYLADIGVPPDVRAILGNVTFDVAAFARSVDRRRPARRRDDGVRRLLVPAQLIPRKNHRRLFHALAGIRSPRIETLLAGEGPERDQLAAAAPPGVRFLGHCGRAEVLNLLAQVDVLVLPSVMDQWPQAVNEGMAAGLAVVVSEQADVDPDLAEDGRTAAVVDAMDVASIRAGILRVLDDPSSFGHAARRRLLDDYALGKVAQRFVSAIERWT